jgi:hypothetical protein
LACGVKAIIEGLSKRKPQKRGGEEGKEERRGRGMKGKGEERREGERKRGKEKGRKRGKKEKRKQGRRREGRREVMN